MTDRWTEHCEIVAASGTDEWMEARRSGIGASEAAAVAGLSPWSQPLEVFLRKRGEIPEFGGNTATRMGTRLEPIVIEEFVEQAGVKVAQYPCPMVRSLSHPWMTATPDALLENGELLEAKTTTSFAFRGETEDGTRRWGDEASADVPTEYLIQTQWQMGVTGYNRCHLACLVDGRDLKTYVIDRDDAVIAILIEIGAKFWDRVQNNDAPDPIEMRDGNTALAKAIYRTENGEVIDLSEESIKAWAEYRECSEQIKELERAKDALRAKVLHEIGNNFAGDLQDGYMIRRKLIDACHVSYDRPAYWDVRRVKSKRKA